MNGYTIVTTFSELLYCHSNSVLSCPYNPSSDAVFPQKCLIKLGKQVDVTQGHILEIERVRQFLELTVFQSHLRSCQVRSGQVRSECLTCTFRVSCCSARLACFKCMCVCMYANEPKGLKLINKQTGLHRFLCPGQGGGGGGGGSEMGPPVLAGTREYDQSDRGQ